MLKTFRDRMLEYPNHCWGQKIFIWSSVAILLGTVAYAVSLGLGNETGSGVASSKFVMLISLLLAIPALIGFHLAVALAWAIVSTIVRLSRGDG